MSSFTYTVWSNFSLTDLTQKLQEIFEEFGFSLTHPLSGKIHCWAPEEVGIEASALNLNPESYLPIGLQWWKGEDDIFVSIDNETNVGGYVVRVTLVGFPRQKQAELARLLIEYITPEKKSVSRRFFCILIECSISINSSGSIFSVSCG